MAVVFGKKHVGEFSAHHQAQGITNTSNDIPSMPIHDKKIQLHFFLLVANLERFFFISSLHVTRHGRGEKRSVKKTTFQQHQHQSKLNTANIQETSS